MTTSFELNGHLTTAVGLPFIASLLVARVYKRGWVRWFSALVTSVSLTLVASVAWCLGLGSHDAGWAIDQTSRLPLPSSQALLGLDVLGAQIAVIVSLLVLGTIVGAPHRVMAGGNARRILALHGATIGLVCSRDLVLIGLFWGLGALLAVPREPHERGRAIGIFSLLSCISLLLSFMLIGYLRTTSHLGPPSPFSTVLAGGTNDVVETIAFSLLLVAILIRQGVFPFHSWIPAVLERSSLGLGALLVNTHMGAYVFVRVGLPLFPEVARGAMPWVARLALLTVLLGSLLAFGQTRLRRAIAFIMMSQSALLMVGLNGLNHSSFTGGLTHWCASSLALTGLALVCWSIESRVGDHDLRRFGGLSYRAPGLAAAFLFLGLSSVGLPGTLGFVSEDLLIHGILAQSPRLGTLIVISTALNGFKILSIFCHVFLGPFHGICRDASLSTKEYGVLMVFASLLCLGGLRPSIVVGPASLIARQHQLPAAGRH